MKNNTFKITELHYIQIDPLNVAIEQISFMNEMHIFWHTNNTQMLIGIAWSSELIDNLVDVLSNALNNI